MVCRDFFNSFMPERLWRIAGFNFGFRVYSNEHRPIHVHVRYGGGEAVFEVEHEVELRESFGLKVAELEKAPMLAELNKETILHKWHEYFD